PSSSLPRKNWPPPGAGSATCPMSSWSTRDQPANCKTPSKATCRAWSRIWNGRSSLWRSIYAMSLDVGRYRLLSAHKSLLEHWEETRLVWQDSVREEFFKESLEPLAPLLHTTLGAID